MLEHLQPRKVRVGVLDFGDGRHYLQSPLEPVNREFREQLVRRLEAAGFEVVVGDDVIWQNEIAVRNGRRMAAAGVDAVVFNFSVWAWPQYARVAAQFCPQPIVMFSNVNPRYPGLVGMLANSGSLDQAGIPFTKSFGDVADDQVFGRLQSQIAGVAAARRLRGLTYCLIGGRSLGIDTTVIDPAQWMKQFGIDVDHVDQFELVRRAEIELAKGKRVAPAMDYLEKTVSRIHWTHPDAKFRLTKDLLRRQVAMYYAAHRSDRGVQIRLLRHQGSARADRALRDCRRGGGIPQRSVRTRWCAETVRRLFHGGRFGCGADHADLQAPVGNPGAVCRRAPLPPGPRRVGSLQQRRACNLLRRPQYSIRRSTSHARSSVRRGFTSRQVVPLSITSPHRDG